MNQPSMSFMQPIMMSAYLNAQIRSLPEDAFDHIFGLKCFYNLFKLLEITDTYRKENLRWDEQDEKGLLSTKGMVNSLKKGLEKELGYEIPENSIFKEIA